MPPDPDFLQGIVLFDRGEYFAAHEVWEIPWRSAIDPDRAFYQSLIQAAVALYHHGKGNPDAARRMAARGRAKLGRCPPTYRGIALADFWAAVDAALGGGPAPRIAPTLQPTRTAHGHENV